MTDKKILIPASLLLVLMVIFVVFTRIVTASTAPQNTDTSQPEPEAQKTILKTIGGEDKTEISVLYETFISYTDTLGYQHIDYIAELQNTGTVALSTSDFKVEIFKNDELIKTTDIENRTVLTPTQKIYIVQEVFLEPTLLNPNDIIKTSSSITPVKNENIFFVGNEIISTEIKKLENGYLEVSGELKFFAERQYVKISCPIFDENGNLISKATTILESIKPCTINFTAISQTMFTGQAVDNLTVQVLTE